ncbi:hypothetical protein KP509_23G046700 [Ceratopteris richardii]|nr:hypothetical protein KP509_23G046700 [Ceratopteris richardii]
MALGSLFSITENGTVEEFIQDIDYSRITATLGVTIDSHRQRILTVINNVFDNPSGFHGVACYDLNSKARLFLAKFDKQAWPNDITVDRISGFAFVTDSANDVIYKVSQSGEASEFVKDPLFKSQSIVAVDPAAVRSGLNGITFAEDYLLVIQSNSGKLFKVTLHDHHVHVVDMDECLVAADGISMRKDGLLIVVSTDMLWLVKSRDHWDSAFVVQEVPLDRSFNATSVTFRDPKYAIIAHAYFQDIFTIPNKGMDGLPGGQFRPVFSLQEVQLVGDPDNDPIWLIMIGVIFLVIFGAYKLQMWWFFKKYNQLKKDY